jgi:hypothetical protein
MINTARSPDAAKLLRYAGTGKMKKEGGSGGGPETFFCRYFF